MYQLVSNLVHTSDRLDKICIKISLISFCRLCSFASFPSDPSSSTLLRSPGCECRVLAPCHPEACVACSTVALPRRCQRLPSLACLKGFTDRYIEIEALLTRSLDGLPICASRPGRGFASTIRIRRLVPLSDRLGISLALPSAFVFGLDLRSLLADRTRYLSQAEVEKQDHTSMRRHHTLSPPPKRDASALLIDLHLILVETSSMCELTR